MKLIFKMFNKLDEVISIIALIGIIGLVSVNIFSRFFFNISITWTEEISLALFVWLVFSGFSVVMKNNEHVSIDYFVRKLPEKFYRLNQYLVMVLISISVGLIFVIWGGILTLHSAWNMTPVLGIGYEWIYLAVPVGGLLSIYHIINFFIGKKHHIILQQNQEEVK